MKPVHLINSGELRGVVSMPRSDASAAAMIAQLNSAFDEFKANLEARQSNNDVLLQQKEERLQNEMSDLQAAIDALTARQDQLALGGGAPEPGSQLSAEARAHHDAWNTFMRTGEGERELDRLGLARGGQQAALIQQVRAAGSVGADDKGGYVAPIEWDRTITDARIDITPMRRFASQQNVTGQGFIKLFNKRGTASGWVGETDARPQTGSPDLAAYAYSFGEIYAMPSATQGLLDDAEIDFAAWLGGEVDTEFAYQEGVAFISGNGVNKPRGLLTFDSATEGALAANLRHPLGPITEVKSGHATELTVNGLISLVYDLPSDRSQGAAFYANRKSMALVRKLVDGDGNLIWAPSLAVGQPSTLLGQPVNELSGMPDVAAGTIPMFYGNMAMTYRIFDRKGVRILRDPFTAKPYVLFYTTKRVGGGLWNPEWGRYHRVAA